MSENIRESAKKPEAAKEDKISQIRKSEYLQPVNSSFDRILFLQRTIGNQAVGRLIKSGALQTEPVLQRKDESSICPPTPTGLGKIIPVPACPKATHIGTKEISRFNFCLDSDQLSSPEQLQELNEIVKDNPSSTRYLVHGYASIEGNPTYNFRLSCHRANRIAKALGDALRIHLLRKKNMTEERIEVEIKSRIEVASQGPTNEFAGGPQSNRVVVLYAQIPGGEESEEPGCEDAPRHIGDIKPEISCDLPTVDLTRMNGSPHLRHFNFCLDSDVLAVEHPSVIGEFASRQATKARFIVHGFASVEGQADYNKRLSCHRALRIARELRNAGVRPEQLHEVSGLGRTDVFGDPDFNRVVVVLAEDGTIDQLEDHPRPAVSLEQKLAIVEEARNRLMAGQYNMAADAYISFWTCGRTNTVRQAVEHLRILVQEDQEEPMIRERANGIEEGIGINTIRVSNTALRADNPFECTMGRIVDMSFHHAVIGDFDLNPDLANPSNPLPRHLAGLHLAYLAGFSACVGRRAGARNMPRAPVGIDEPLSSDPRANIQPPQCAEAPQPTRLLTPVKGTREREAPDFLVYEKNYKLNSGSLIPVDIKSIKPYFTETVQNVIDASARVSLLGKPDVFADYEIGFIQTILEDMTLAEYNSGDRVLQKLPVPIRATQTKDSTPAPWMASTAMVRPDENGQVSLNASWRLATEFASYFQYFRTRNVPRVDRLDTWQRHTNVAIWLAARRLGAPLDRFSVHFLDGVIYDVTQNFNVDVRRVRGDLEPEDAPEYGGEFERTIGVGSFQTSKTSEDPADSHIAQLGNPVAGEIDLNRQTSKFLEPEATTELGGMGIEEYREVVKQILDKLMVFDTEESMIEGTGGTLMPRLGFEFSPLDIHILIERRTGRVITYLLNGEPPVTIISAGLGDRALYHLQKALVLRLSKRDYLGQGRSVILGPKAIKEQDPGTAAVARIKLNIPPSSSHKEYNLAGDERVLNNMAEMWDCTALTKTPDFVQFGQREFGRTYWMDRNQVLHGDPSDRFVMGEEEVGGVYVTKLPCGPYPAGFKIGTIHTHPEPEDPPRAYDGDIEMAKSGNCGNQHYIVTDTGVYRYYSDGRLEKVSVNLPKGVKCHQKNLEEKR